MHAPSRGSLDWRLLDSLLMQPSPDAVPGARNLAHSGAPYDYVHVVQCADRAHMMPLRRALLALLSIAAVTAIAGAPQTSGLEAARRGLKDAAQELNLRGSLSKAVRGALKRVVTASHRPEERKLIDLPGQSQTVCTCSLMLLPPPAGPGACCSLPTFLNTPGGCFSPAQQLHGRCRMSAG